MVHLDLNWKWIWKWTLIGFITLIIATNLIASYVYMKSKGGYEVPHADFLETDS